MTDNLPSTRKYFDNVICDAPKEIKSFKDSAILHEDDISEEHKAYLSKGKYDIDYAIGICKMVLGHCEQHKFDTSANLSISLKYSLDKLIKFLESEKRPRCKDPIVLWTCPKCKDSIHVHKSNEDRVICGNCLSDQGIKFLPTIRE